MSDTPLRNDGAWLQDALAAALKSFCEYNKAYYHRFPDTKSARGNFLKSQPGDFMLLTAGTSILIECKSTLTNTKLLSLAKHGEVGKRQLGKHRLWHRSGCPSLYLWSNEQKEIEWHNGRLIVNGINNALYRGNLAQLPESLILITTIITDKNDGQLSTAV